jgi:hypothetical protein
VQVGSTRKRTASFGNNWPGQFMHSPQVKTLDTSHTSRRCINSASSQRQAGENHAAKAENCNTRLAIVQHTRFRQPGSQQNDKLEHRVDAPFFVSGAHSQIDTVQAMYCKWYQRQSNVTATGSQPAKACNIARLARRLWIYRRPLHATQGSYEHPGVNGALTHSVVVLRSPTSNLTQF